MLLQVGVIGEGGGTDKGLGCFLGLSDNLKEACSVMSMVEICGILDFLVTRDRIDSILNKSTDKIER